MLQSNRKLNTLMQGILCKNVGFELNPKDSNFIPKVSIKIKKSHMSLSKNFDSIKLNTQILQSI